jgi:hypothetical protein
MIALLLLATFGAPELVRLYPGYVTRVQCEGRLLVSAVGNDSLVRLEALPKELGCGVLLKPVSTSGRTNLILETSTGTIERVIEILPAKGAPSRRDLHFRFPGVTS